MKKDDPDVAMNIQRTEIALQRGSYGTKFEIGLARYSGQRAGLHLQGADVLELGCGFGFSTCEIAKYVSSIRIVDASEQFVELTRNMIHPEVRSEFVSANWMDYQPERKFTDVILFRGIEYFPEISPLLEKVKSFLVPGGRFHLLITNNRSLHKQAAIVAGLEQPGALSAFEHEIGKAASYSAAEMEELLLQNGFHVIHKEGIGLKPLPNAVMSDLDEGMREAFLKMGNLYPEMAAESYFISEWK